MFLLTYLFTYLITFTCTVYIVFQKTYHFIFIASQHALHAERDIVLPKLSVCLMPVCQNEWTYRHTINF